MEPSQIHEVRQAPNRELVLGRDDFKEKIEEMTKRQTRSGVMGRSRINEGAGIYYVL